MRTSILFAGIISISLVAAKVTSAQEQVYDWSVKHNSQRGASQMTVNHIRTDAAGNVYTIGIFTDTINFGGGPVPDQLVGAQSWQGNGQYDFYITKQAKDSTLIWIKRLNKRSFRFNDIYASPSATGFELDAAGNIYICGSFPGTLDVDPGSDSLNFTGPFNVLGNANSSFVAKYDNDGDLLWGKHFNSNVVPYPGTSFTRASSVRFTRLTLSHTGNVFLSGYTAEAVAGDTITYDPNGQNYQKTFTNTEGKNIGFWASVDPANGNLLDMKMSKQAQTGNLSTRFYAIPADNNSEDVYVSATFTNTVDIALEGQAPYTITALVPGNVSYNTFVARYDSAGAVKWANVFYGRSNSIGDIQLDAKGNPSFAVTFNDSLTVTDTGSYYNHYVQKSGMVVGKFDSTGAMRWEDKVDFALVNDNEYVANNISFDAFDNLYVSGTVKGRIYPNAPASTVYSHGFSRKYTDAGTIDWTERYGNTAPLMPSETITGNFIHIDRSNNRYHSGQFVGTAQFAIDPLHTPSTTMSTASVRANYIAKYTCEDTSTTILDIVACNEFEYAGTIYDQSGSHRFHYWSQGGCDSFVVLNLTVNNIDEPFITVNGYELGVTSSYDNYQWLLNGQLIPGAAQSTYTVNENGMYQVIAGLSNGCSDTSDVYEVTNMTSLRENALLAAHISVYPNPSDGILFIKTPVALKWDLSSIDGRTIQESTDHQNSIKLSGLAEGVYLLKIYDHAGGFIKTERIVLKK